MRTARLQYLLRAHHTRLREEFYVEEIGLFGSFMREEAVAHSDIDILVTFRKGHKDVFNYMRLKHFLEDMLGQEVDLVLKEALRPRLRDKFLGEVEYVS
ncbi:MAG: nucleotidyltransferase family protein [Salinibacter sp.]